MKVIIIDTTGKVVRSFSSVQEAENFKTVNSRYDWSIKKAYKRKATTERQKAAVRFCEEWLNVKFIGDIEDSTVVSAFLNEYLDDAKNMYEEIKCEYESYIEDLYD